MARGTILFVFNVPLLLCFSFLFGVFFFFIGRLLATLHGMQDRSSWTRD